MGAVEKMKITFNGKSHEARGLEAVFWGFVVLSITATSFFLVGVGLLLGFLIITSPVWIIVLILLNLK